MKIINNSALIIGLVLSSLNIARSQSSTFLHSETPVLKIYPNPNKEGEDTHVDLKGFKADDLLVVVYDMLGREIYSKIEVSEDEGFLFTISTDGKKLPSGIYLISASANDNIFRQKLIVK